MKIKGVDYVIYQVKDLKKSIEFYRDTLGLKPLGEPGESWAEFDCGNVTLDIGTFSYDPKVKGGNNAQVGFAVDDVPATLADLKKKGVTVLYDTYETPVCWGAAIADPDGNVINIHKRKDGTFGEH